MIRRCNEDRVNILLLKQILIGDVGARARFVRRQTRQEECRLLVIDIAYGAYARARIVQEGAADDGAAPAQADDAEIDAIVRPWDTRVRTSTHTCCGGYTGKQKVTPIHDAKAPWRASNAGFMNVRAPLVPSSRSS